MKQPLAIFIFFAITGCTYDAGLPMETSRPAAKPNAPTAQPASHESKPDYWTSEQKTKFLTGCVRDNDRLENATGVCLCIADGYSKLAKIESIRKALKDFDEGHTANPLSPSIFKIQDDCSKEKKRD